MTVNVPLLRRTLAHIEAHPEEHNQDYFRCQTPCGMVMCFAGHAAVLAGCTWVGDGSEMVTLPGIEEPRHVEWVAQDLLGLTESQSEELFWDAQDLDDLRRIVAELTDGAP